MDALECEMLDQFEEVACCSECGLCMEKGEVTKVQDREDGSCFLPLDNQELAMEEFKGIRLEERGESRSRWLKCLQARSFLAVPSP